MRCFLAAASALLALAPGAIAIYGGTPAADGAYPFMVHVFQHGDRSDNDASTGGFICGGFLVAPRLVVTAGHCIESAVDRIPVLGEPLSGGPYDNPQALIGGVDRGGTGGEVIDIVAMHQHPQWFVGAGFGANDIGVFELASDSSMTPVRAAVPGDEDLYAAGATATVIGYGWTPEGELPDALMQVEVPVYGDADCKSRPQYTVLFIPEEQVCAGSDGLDSCGGDSGGPLLVRDGDEWVAAGIVSYGPVVGFEDGDPVVGACGDPDHPGVYIEVAAFQGFIDAYR